MYDIAQACGDGHPGDAAEAVDLISSYFELPA